MASSFPMKKNAGTRVVFPILDADGDPVPAAAGLDSEYSIDGANFGDCTNEATEIGVASGVYYLDLESGETNGDVIAIQVKTTTVGAKTTILVFYTSAQTLDELDVVVDGVKAKTDLIGASVAPASEYDVEMGRITANVATEAKQDEMIADIGVFPTANYATIAAYVEDVRTRLAAIVADTGELQTDWADGGRLDLILDAILADTDAMEKIQTNRWQIVANQLIIYDDDAVTPLYTFNLFDSVGVGAMENVYERVPV